jgi:LmbE family N-acetylglucosaminyl deacetylase
MRFLVSSPPPANDRWAPAAGPVVVVAPHPDDEVIGCGGTIRRHTRAGDPVTVLYLTRGENSRGYPWLSPAQKQATRVREARASCAVLGVADAAFFDGIDGNLCDPACLADLSAKVAAAVRARCPKLIYVPHAGDNHPDHIAAYRMVVQIARDCVPAVAVYQYELWSPLAADFAIDISREMRSKIRAIKCHQLALDAFDYVPTMIGLAAYRSGTLLQRRGYAEAFRRSPEIHRS